MMLDAAKVISEMPSHQFDVMRQYATVHGTKRARYERKGYQWSKLAECASYYGYEFPAHNSLEDSIAAAFCYRSLLSDAEWAMEHYKDIAPKLKRVPLKQNKDSAASINALVEGGLNDSVPAELRLGAITQGVNKGAPRYECFIDNLCVGVQGNGELDGIKRLFMVTDDSDLPETIKCRAVFSITNGKAKCTATISENGTILNETKPVAAKKTSTSALQPIASASTQPEKMTVRKAGPIRMLASLALAVVAAFAIFMSLFGLTMFEFSVPWLMVELTFVIPALVVIKLIKKILS